MTGVRSRYRPTVDCVIPVKTPSEMPRSRILFRPGPRLVTVMPDTRLSSPCMPVTPDLPIRSEATAVMADDESWINSGRRGAVTMTSLT